jgi:hypothetical protein
MTFTSLLRHRAIDDDSSRPRHQTGDHIDLVATLRRSERRRRSGSHRPHRYV